MLWDWGQGRERSPVAVLSQSSARDNSTRTGERYARVVPIHSSYVRLVVFSASARLSEADLCEILQRTTDLLASHRCERGCVTVDINCDLSNSCTLEVDCQLRLSGALNDPLKPDRPADHAKSRAMPTTSQRRAVRRLALRERQTQNTQERRAGERALLYSTHRCSSVFGPDETL